MLPKLLLIFLVLIGIGVLVFRLSGSGAEVSRRTHFFINPFKEVFDITLPGDNATTSGINPFFFPSTPEIPLDEINKDGLPASYFDAVSEKYTATGNDLTGAEEEYDVLQRRIVDAQNFGAPSPYRGLVGITESYGGIAADEASLEYIVLAAAPENTAPVSLEGWSLQSTRSRERYYIPAGSRSFTMGRVSDVERVALNPGERAIVGSGSSPVGVSFRENLCTGYLGQFQTFLPTLDFRCPTAENEVLSEPATARTSDPTCVEFASSIPRCSFFVGEPPHGVSTQCYSFIRNSLTYNGCVARHGWRPSFASDTWRLFLGRSKELWQNDTDVIRLFDKEGRTVDSWSY